MLLFRSSPNITLFLEGFLYRNIGFHTKLRIPKKTVILRDFVGLLFKPYENCTK